MSSLDFQSEKQVVLDYHADLDSSDSDTVAAVLERWTQGSYLWRGFHPFNQIDTATEVARQFWVPLRTALFPMQRRMDVFMAGRNQIDGFQSVWVVSMGHLMGLLDKPWLGIPATGKLVMLRYCEFHRIDAGKIAETAMYFDIPHLMTQAGLAPFPPQTGAALVQPGPMPHDAVMLTRQDPAEADATLTAINFMVDDLRNWGSTGLSLEDELRRSWHEDMLWWGPGGIGATYTIERYAKQHSGPFRAGFRDRIFNGHICKLAEGHYGGFFGWPNLSLISTGGFMGLPGSNTPGDMRVIDIYRRSGEKLAENWIFIDLLHFWHQQGLDVLARSAEVPRT